MPPGEPALVRLFWDNMCITVPLAAAIMALALHALNSIAHA